MKLILMLPVSVRWVLILTAANMISFSFGLSQPGRLVVALAFLLTCPGVVLVDLLSIDDLPGQAATSVGASLAVNLLVVTVLLTFDDYSVERALVTVTVISFVVALYTAISASHAPARGELKAT